MTARAVIALVFAIGGLSMLITDAPGAEVPEVPSASATEVFITSTLDGTEQPSVVVVPDGYDPARPTPVLLGMHTWSADYLARCREHVEAHAGQDPESITASASYADFIGGHLPREHQRMEWRHQQTIRGMLSERSRVSN